MKSGRTPIFVPMGGGLADITAPGVRYCTFRKGEGRMYPGLLRERLRETQPDLGPCHGEFLLVAAPSYNYDDPHQPWLAYSIEKGIELAPSHPTTRFWPLSSSEKRFEA